VETEVLERLHRDGYAVVERLIPVDHAAAIREELTAVLASVPLGRNDFEGFATRRIYNVFAKTRSLDELAVHPLLTAVLDDVLGLYQFSAPVGIEVGPGEVAQPLHYDDAIYPLPWPHEDVVVNSMWAFDDFVEANGATRVVPGSHHRSTAEYDPDQPTIPLEMPAGSVVFYTGTLLHRGGANRTDRPRLGVILEYCAGWIRAQENHVIGVPPDVVRTLPARLQELLGYNVYPPFIGNVDGRHPRKYLETPSAERLAGP
jgi:ectoine hydroxylase-related dioxygenase (phytanoyl-CoA dioxygenase family)